jgi:hypothetical protein
MAAQIDIVNRALVLIGEPQLTTLDDDTKTGRLARDDYDATRRAVLRDHYWNFAVRRVSIAASSTAPEWGFSLAYPLPADYLRIIEVYGGDTNAWKIEGSDTDGRVIVTDLESPIDVRYITDHTNVERMDVLFREALSARLAMDWAMSITKAATVQERMTALYMEKMREARAVDGQEGTPDEWIASDWINARF